MRAWYRERLGFSVLILPVTAWLVVFFTLPLALIWVYSFGDRGPDGRTIVAFSLDNYARAVEWIHLGIIWRSVWIATVTAVICLLIGFPLAMGIAFAPRRWKMPLLLLVILPFWTNLLIRTYAWIAILRTRGLLNSALEWAHDWMNDAFALIGRPDQLGPFRPLELLYDWPAVIIGLVYVNLPFLVLPLYATLEKLDKAYLEASFDLGASQWRTFVSVVVPLALPGIATGILLVFILSLGSYLTPDLLGGPYSEMVGNLIARQFREARDWAFGSALVFLLLYATFIFLWTRAALAARVAGGSGSSR